MLTLQYLKQGQPSEVALGTTGPSIDIEAGQELQLTGFKVQLLPTQKTSSGISIVRYRNVPSPPEDATKLKFRVLAYVRKQLADGPCWDKADGLASPWTAGQETAWQIDVPGRLWTVGRNWDQIQIDIQIRFDSEPNAEYQHLVNAVFLQPSQLGDRLASNVRQNVFMAVYDKMRGKDDRECQATK